MSMMPIRPPQYLCCRYRLAASISRLCEPSAWILPEPLPTNREQFEMERFPHSWARDLVKEGHPIRVQCFQPYWGSVQVHILAWQNSVHARPFYTSLHIPSSVPPFQLGAWFPLARLINRFEMSSNIFPIKHAPSACVSLVADSRFAWSLELSYRSNKL